VSGTIVPEQSASSVAHAVDATIAERTMLAIPACAVVLIMRSGFRLLHARPFRDSSKW
jgi:hypothetical protein